MKIIPIHTQDIESKNYSGVAKGIKRSIPGLNSHAEALEILAKLFGYANHKQVISTASYLPRIDKTPEEYFEILKQNSVELGNFDIHALSMGELKYLISFGYFIAPIVDLDQRTIDVIRHYYFESILDDLNSEIEISSPIRGFKKLIKEALSLIPESDHDRFFNMPLSDFFLEFSGRSIFNSWFLELHRAKCYQAIMDATYTGLYVKGPGIVLKGTHEKGAVFTSITTESVMQTVVDRLHDSLFVNGTVKCLNFFVNHLDETAIKLSDFHLDDTPTLVQVKKEYAEEKMRVATDNQPISFMEYAKDFYEDFYENRDGDFAVLAFLYEDYLKEQKEELSEILREVEGEYEIPLKLESIEKKKKHGQNTLIFKLSEEFGEGDTGSVIPYSWTCTIRTSDGDILCLASGHIYSASLECEPSISDIFIFEDNYTIDYDLYVGAFAKKLSAIQGIANSYFSKPSICEYLEDGQIVFMKNLYRDQSGKSSPGDGIAVLKFAVACMYKYFESDLLLVSFVDPPQYTANDADQPESIKKLQKRDVDKICSHIYNGLSEQYGSICEFIFIEPEYKSD